MTSDMSTAARVAIIGCGPRGLGAAEALVKRFEGSGCSLDLHIFEPHPFPGAGPNFSPDQTAHCILNIPIRDIAIEPATHQDAALPSFAKWLEPDQRDPDRFPPRSEIGSYLSKRFDELYNSARPMVQITHHAIEIGKVQDKNGVWYVQSADLIHGPFDEVLLTLGQPQTEPDDQLQTWREHATATAARLSSAYPANELVEEAQGWAGKNVAIRGLGLSTLDVIRLLTQGLGGSFEDGTYVASGREPKRLLPFSLDGQPPVPKPATGAIDAIFTPDDRETKAFEQSLGQAITGGGNGTRALALICDALATAALRILRAAGTDVDAQDINNWLSTERETPGGQETRDPMDALRSNVQIANGDASPDVGYAIGQLWRHWQDVLRHVFNTTTGPSDVTTAILMFDEGLKRYSYGPPVEAAEQLLSLINQGLVNLVIADDPDIRLTATGWALSEDGDRAEASVMIDAVLPAPNLTDISANLPRDLQTRGVLVSLDDGLGARIGSDGGVLTQQGETREGLSLLGRLALGSFIAVDSLHDCFGGPTQLWASQVVDRHQAKR